MNSGAFYKLVQQQAGLANRDEAEEATRIVFELLSHRITREEADDVRAQLPTDLKSVWDGGHNMLDWLKQRFTPQNTFNRQEFLAQVTDRKETIPASPEQLVKAVFFALQSQISEGEADDVAGQLPRDLRALWQEASPHRTASGMGQTRQSEVYTTSFSELGGQY